MSTDRSLKATVPPDMVSAGPATVGSAAMRPPIAVARGATVLEAARTMTEHKIGAVVIGDAHRSILTERDVVFAAVEGRLDDPATSYATADPVIVPTETLLDEAARIMATEGVRHLLVEEDRRIVGLFSVRDLLANQTLVEP